MVVRWIRAMLRGEWQPPFPFYFPNIVPPTDGSPIQMVYPADQGTMPGRIISRRAFDVPTRQEFRGVVVYDPRQENGSATMAETAAERPEGHYWLKDADGWTVALWQDQRWAFIDGAGLCSDEEREAAGLTVHSLVPEPS